MNVAIAAALALVAWILYCRSQYKTKFRRVLEGPKSVVLYTLSWMAALVAFAVLIYPFLLQ